MNKFNSLQFASRNLILSKVYVFCLDNLWFESQERKRDFSCFQNPDPASYTMVTGALLPGTSGGVEANRPLRLLPQVRMTGSIPPRPYMPSLHVYRHLHILCFFVRIMCDTCLIISGETVGLCSHLLLLSVSYVTLR